MLTQKQIIDAVRSGRKCEALDGRDYSRLADFFPESDLDAFGFSLKAGATWNAKPWTEDEVRKQLKDDVEFAFEKAYNQRGISASFMHAVVKMWMWVLEDDELKDGEDFDDYGVSYLRRVAVNYGLTDPGE